MPNLPPSALPTWFPPLVPPGGGMPPTSPVPIALLAAPQPSMPGPGTAGPVEVVRISDAAVFRYRVAALEAAVGQVGTALAGLDPVAKPGAPPHPGLPGASLGVGDGASPSGLRSGLAGGSAFPQPAVPAEMSAAMRKIDAVILPGPSPKPLPERPPAAPRDDPGSVAIGDRGLSSRPPAGPVVAASLRLAAAVDMVTAAAREVGAASIVGSPPRPAPERASAGARDAAASPGGSALPTTGTSATDAFLPRDGTATPAEASAPTPSALDEPGSRRPNTQAFIVPAGTDATMRAADALRGAAEILTSARQRLDGAPEAAIGATSAGEVTGGLAEAVSRAETQVAFAAAQVAGLVPATARVPIDHKGGPGRRSAIVAPPSAMAPPWGGNAVAATRVVIAVAWLSMLGGVVGLLAALDFPLVRIVCAVAVLVAVGTIVLRRLRLWRAVASAIRSG